MLIAGPPSRREAFKQRTQAGPSPAPLVQPAARLVLYSGTADVPSVDIVSLFNRKGVANLGNHIREISARSKFKVKATLTKEYNKKYTENRAYNMITFKILYGGKAHAVNLFNTGKITFTGGYPSDASDIMDTPRRILRIALGEDPDDMKINNVTVQYEGGYHGALGRIREALQGEIKQHFVSKTVGAFKIRMYGTGAVQVSGITTQSQVARAGSSVARLIQTLMSSGVVVPHERVVRNKRTRPQNRENNQIAPDVATRTTTCPRDRRPVPYSFDGEVPKALSNKGKKYYIAPNPQGQPCCYKVPRRIAYLRNKVINRFARLGLRVPNRTKQVFAITNNNDNKPVNVSGEVNMNVVFSNGAKGFKIGSRQATRYTMTRLVDIARRLGVAMNVRGKTAGESSKAAVIGAIKNWANRQNKIVRQGQAVVTRTTNVRNSNQGILRLGPRGRVASSYSKPQLAVIAMKLNPPFSLDTSKPMKDLLADLRSHVTTHGEVYSSNRWPTTKNLKG